MHKVGSVIYVIENKKNGKKYIGQTTDLNERWRKHQADLNAGRHHSPSLQNSWNYHGSEAFKPRILKSINDSSRLDFVEQQFIRKYKPAYNTIQTTWLEYCQQKRDRLYTKIRCLLDDGFSKHEIIERLNCPGMTVARVLLSERKLYVKRGHARKQK